MKKNILLIISLLMLVSSVVFADTLTPGQILDSDITVQLTYVGTMPSRVGVKPNLASPVSVGKHLYLIDQNEAIYRFSDKPQGNAIIEQVFHVNDAPDGLTLNNKEAILNIAPAKKRKYMYVMFSSSTEPTTDITIHPLPSPLTDVCCDLDVPVLLDDLYRVGDSSKTGRLFINVYHVLYEYELQRGQLINPRAIVAFEAQQGNPHTGGGLLTLPNGKLLFAAGDNLPSGTDGRFPAQDTREHVSKLILINPQTGDIEVAAQGVRNVQHIELVSGPKSFGSSYISFADIGGVTAEEINYISVREILDTTFTENFGWGRNADGLAREGTFYVQPGMALVGEQPATDAGAPSPEPGFVQPQAQYGRNDPNGGFAVSGPVSSNRSFHSISALFGDLSTGNVYATTTDDATEIDAPVYKVNMVDQYGIPLASLNEFIGSRVDPRFFRFPNGTAGVLLEKTGDFYRIKEISNKRGRRD